MVKTTDDSQPPEHYSHPRRLPDRFEDIPVSELGIGERTLSELDSCGVYYLRDLANVTDAEMLTWHGFGPRVVGEIKGAMKVLYWRWLHEGESAKNRT